MGVLDRLRRITGEEKQATDNATRTAEAAELRRRIEEIMARRPQEQPRRAKTYPPLDELIEGEEIVTGEGAFFLSTLRAKSHQRHGSRTLGDLAGLNMEAAALLANNREIARYPVSEGLFLDTETTGLAGGTGTLAFMIGVGWFAENAFVTQQIFIRDYSEEKAALAYLSDIAKAKKFLVTFNGKAFDANLLAARFILNRLANPLENLAHADLLFPSRRLCGHRLENSRLVTLEQELLEFYRDDDIPGMEIPARYFSWLRRRDPLLVVDIFRHNRLDILSLALLNVHLSELIAPSPDSSRRDDPRDVLAAARLLQDRNEHGHAACLLHDLAACDDSSVRFASQRMLSLILKRKGDWERAALLWKAMMREYPGDPFAAVELAKWYEHGCRDIAAAHTIVSRLLEDTESIDEAVREALIHRLSRLQSRLP